MSSVVIHDNRMRYRDNPWCLRWSITVGGLVVWSGDEIADVPHDAVARVCGALHPTSLYGLIRLFA